MSIQQQMEHIPQAVKTAGDWGSFGLVVATLFKWLPEATALLSFIWVCIRIYETETVQRLVKRK